MKYFTFFILTLEIVCVLYLLHVQFALAKFQVLSSHMRLSRIDNKV